MAQIAQRMNNYVKVMLLKSPANFIRQEQRSFCCLLSEADAESQADVL